MSTPSFHRVLAEHSCAPLTRREPTWLQVNVGKRCNQACLHCHVDAGPKRTEMMTEQTAERVLSVLAATPAIELVDLTGGAPELNPSFHHLVAGSRHLGKRVLDRCNLTVMFEPGMEELPERLAEYRVEITASLPCYGPDNVDAQRGKGVFERSIRALRRLNALGYGRPGTGLVLDLVYNPLGPSLPPPQYSLEQTYKQRLRADFGIEFSRLLTLTNMPIARFAHQLHRDGAYAAYMQLLLDHFNPATLDGLMCRTLVSVDWRGNLYDCDFNQMLGLDLGDEPTTIWDVDDLSSLAGESIAVGTHCLGCTAGAGSSCGGNLL